MYFESMICLLLFATIFEKIGRVINKKEFFLDTFLKKEEIFLKSFEVKNQQWQIVELLLYKKKTIC